MDWSGCESSLEPPFPRQEYVRARLTLTPSCLSSGGSDALPERLGPSQKHIQGFGK